MTVRRRSVWKLAAAVAAVAVSLLAPAVGRADTTYDTTPAWNGSEFISSFGDPNTATYGQVIKAPTSSDTVLRDFTFYMRLPTALVFRGELYAWDGSKATGPNLFESAQTHTTDPNSFEAITFDTGGGVVLTPGASYVIFASISRDQATNGGTGLRGEWGWVSSGAYPDGNFAFLNNGYDASLWTSQTWVSVSSADLAFKAHFAAPSADLSVGKTADRAIARPGDQITYTIPVTNRGPQDAANVKLTDSLPANVSFVSASASQGSCSGTTTVSCDLGTLAKGASSTVTIKVSARDAGTAKNTATASSDTSDPDDANNSASATTRIDASPPTITIRRPVDGATYARGQTVRASYSCTDADGPSDITSCKGPVANGQPIDTSTVGRHSFTVTATDSAGNTTTKTVHYTVEAPIRLSVSPRRAEAGTRVCFAFRATATGHPVPGATIHLAGHTARTSPAGNAAICVALRRGTHPARATRHGYRAGHTTITASARPRFTG